MAAYEFIMGALVENPHRVGQALAGPLAGRHCVRRGTYRVLHRIDEAAGTGTILDVTHRRDAKPHTMTH